MIYSGYTIDKIYYSGYTVTAAYSCGGYKVFDTEKKAKMKITKVSDPSKTYQIDCGNSSIITQSEIDECYRNVSGCCVHIDVGDCVTHIGSGATNTSEFRTNCLVSITLPNTLKYIGSASFAGCTSLEHIDIPSGVTSILSMTFDYSALKSIDLHNRINSIGYGAFWNCTLLESITVRATTPPTLGTSAFDNTNNCPIYVPSGSVNTYKSAWSTYASRIQAIQPPPPTPKKLEAIYSDTTEYTVNCDSSTTLTKAEVTGGTGTTAITSANVGSCVEVIGNSAFNTCDNLSAVTISSAITSIEYRAFYNCRNLLSITIYASTPPTRGDGAFPVFGASYTVYVPAEYLNTYKSAWSNISSRIQAIPT